MVKLWRAVVLGLCAVALAASPAAADPPGPTDYRSEIMSVAPETDALSVEILGGDSFVLLVQQRPVEIVVVGYNGEEYLRFLPDGTVQQNRRSPATYFNQDRYGGDNDELPAIADAGALPDWETVDDDGTYAWHDHRAHWMVESRPLGAAAGDQILEGVIPLIVDGSEVDVIVASYWMPAPSIVSTMLGLAVGIGLAALAWRRRETIVALVAMAAVGSALLGVVQFLSVPGETGPSALLWQLPLLALLGAFGGWWFRLRPATGLPLLIASAVASFTFALLRLPGLSKAILPTDLPFWLDRTLTAGVLVAGATGIVLSGVELSRLMGAQPTAPLPEAPG